MATGKFAGFDQANGIGFIEPDDGSCKVLVHVDDVGGQRDLRIGAPLKYSTVQGAHGPKAYNVSVLEPSHDGHDSSSRWGAVPPDNCVVQIHLLSDRRYSQEIADALRAKVPGITAAEIAEVSGKLIGRAARHGWLWDGAVSSGS
jgi:cold shock CspA family protein